MVGIFEGIGQCNIIQFRNYNSNRSSRSNIIGINIGNVIGFYLSFRYMLGNIYGIKIDMQS